MAVASLRYDANMVIDQTQRGLFVYDGTPARFHEWEFRSDMRWDATNEDDRAKTINMIIESLRGEAALVAMDLGSTKPWQPTGSKT